MFDRTKVALQMPRARRSGQKERSLSQRWDETHHNADSFTRIRSEILFSVVLLLIASTAVQGAWIHPKLKDRSPLLSSGYILSRRKHVCTRVAIEDTTQNMQVDDEEEGRSSSVVASAAATERFHEDMMRVLESRKHFLTDLLITSAERHNRPVVLDSDLDGAERVAAMLRHLQGIGAATEESFQIVMRAFCGRGRIRWKSEGSIICAADQLEVLLDELTEMIPASSVSVETYNLVLEAYAACSTPRGDRDYADRANDLLQRMETMFGEVSVESLKHVLHAFSWQQANLQPGECAVRASSLLQKIVDKTDDPAILMQCYDWVLEAWSKSGTSGSAEKADELFSKMKELNSTSSQGSDLFDAETYSNAILAWSKSTESGSAEKSEALLKDMVDQYKAGAFPEGSEPPLIAFNGVITAWGRQGRPGKAEEILWLMDEIRSDCRNLVPDCVSYNSVLHSYIRSPKKDEALENALSMVQYMEENSEEQPAIRPNCFTYGTLIKGWIQSGRPDMAEQAEKALMKMERSWQGGDMSIPPNNRSFNMVINAYAKSNDHFAARKAFDLFNRMKASEVCQPDIITITSVMECLSKSADPNAPAQAESLLEQAFAIYKEKKAPELMPNLRTFTMTILTFAKNQGSVLKARELLTQLVDLYETTQDPQLLPNEYPYNYVLNCAANTLEKKVEAFQIATKTYQEMRQSKFVRPDSYTYAFWLKCCNNLLPQNDLRLKCVSYAFEECKKDGLVTKEVLTRLFQGSPPSLVDELLEIKHTFGRKSYRTVQVRDLPPSWSRNTAVRPSR